MIATFGTLFFAHLLLDYPLQGAFLAENKSKYPYVCFVHSFIWGWGVFLVGKCFLGLDYSLLVPLMLVGVHWVVDEWKCTGKYETMHMKPETAFYIDQFIHFLQILAITVFIF